MQDNILCKLGIPRLNRSQMVLEISERIRCARSWCQQYWELLCDPHLHSRAKFLLYKLFVRPILTYGCELWNLDERNSKKLLRFEGAVLIEIYKSKYALRDPKRLKPDIGAVYSRYRGTDVLDHVKNERLSWKELLKIEEKALERTPKRRSVQIRWWDQPARSHAPQSFRARKKDGGFLRMSPTEKSCLYPRCKSTRAQRPFRIQDSVDCDNSDQSSLTSIE